MAFAAASLPLVLLALVGAPGCSDDCHAAVPPACSRAITAAPASVAPGDSVRITGHGFTNRCGDTSGCKTIRSSKNLQISVDQDGLSWPLRTLDAKRGKFDATLVLPTDLHPGRALMAVGGVNAEITITGPMGH